MGLITKPIKIGPGVWITSRCIVLGGSQIGASAIITPNSVVKAMQTVEPGAVFGQPDAVVLGTRFLRKSENAEQS
jgi:putative colanic acid biosynthesis acetyltransferase WcaF